MKKLDGLVKLNILASRILSELELLTSLICKNRTTASDLCKALSIKPQNIRRDVLDKLINNSLLTVCDEGKINTYIRVGYLDLIGFDKLAINKYPNLR